MKTKKCTKKYEAHAELLFCLLNLLIFIRCHCRRYRPILISLMYDLPSHHVQPEAGFSKTKDNFATENGSSQLSSCGHPDNTDTGYISRKNKLLAFDRNELLLLRTLNNEDTNSRLYSERNS